MRRGPPGPTGPQGIPGAPGMSAQEIESLIQRTFIAAFANSKRMVVRKSRPNCFRDGNLPVVFEPMTLLSRLRRRIYVVFYNTFAKGHVRCPRCAMRVENTGAVWRYLFSGIGQSTTYAYPDNCPFCDTDFKKKL